MIQLTFCLKLIGRYSIIKAVMYIKYILDIIILIKLTIFKRYFKYKHKYKRSKKIMRAYTIPGIDIADVLFL